MMPTLAVLLLDTLQSVLMSVLLCDATTVTRREKIYFVLLLGREIFEWLLRKIFYWCFSENISSLVMLTRSDPPLG